MLKIKIGVFPGRVEEFVVEDGTTVKQALKMANIKRRTGAWKSP